MSLYAPAFGFTHPPFQRPLAADQLFRPPGLEELHSRLRYEGRFHPFLGDRSRCHPFLRPLP